MNRVAGLFLERSSPKAFSEALGFNADPWQLKLLESESPRIIMVCGRQVGKSTVTGMATYMKAKMHPGSLSLVVSRSFRQSLLLFEKIRDAVRNDPDKDAVVERLMQVELRMTNGSKVVAVPGEGETVRGFSGVDLLVIDEAAYVPDSLYSAVSPMLAASGGKVILLSSPAGKEGFFWNVWDRGEGWERYRIEAKECPRISDEFLASERVMLPEHIYKREYEAEFTENITSLVSYEDLQAAFKNDVKSIGKYNMVADGGQNWLPKVEALRG